MLTVKIKKILTVLFAALGIYLLIAGIKSGAGIIKTYDGKIPIWFCILPYVIGLFLVILAIIAMNKNLNKKVSTAMLAALAALILIAGIAEMFNIPENYSNSTIPFYVLPYIVELLIIFSAAVAVRKK